MADQHEEHRKHLASLSNKATKTPDVVFGHLCEEMQFQKAHRACALKAFYKEAKKVRAIMNAHGVARERQGGKDKAGASTSAGHGGAAS